MKRLLAAGHARIFQICRCFRQGELGSRHLPEFTMLEWYRAGADYRELMSECEDLVTTLAQDLDMPGGLVRGGRTIDLRKPWERLTLKEAFERYAPVPLDEALAVGTFDELMAFEVEPRLSMDRPVFIHDFPVSLGALARRKSGNPEVAERFELYIGGLELVNAFSELTDACTALSSPSSTNLTDTGEPAAVFIAFWRVFPSFWPLTRPSENSSLADRTITSLS